MVADDDLPDSLEPALGIPPRPEPPAPPAPKGDLRAVSVIAIATGVVVVAWYLFLVTVSVITDIDGLRWVQVGMWVLAVVSFVCGILCLNARMARELAAAGFIAGVAALLLSISIGLATAADLFG